MSLKKNLLLVIFFSLALLLASCTGSSGKKNSQENSSDIKTMPQGIKDIEKSLQEIMRQADLVPIIGKLASGQGEGTDMTFEETTLGEVPAKENESGSRDKEKKQPLPKDEAEIWNSIKGSLTELHNQWDRLEPQLAEKNVSQEVISKFEDELDRLTVSATAQQPFSVLSAANELTGYLYKFMASFAETPVPLTYEFKYHVRNILLQADSGAYGEAEESLAYMKEQKPALTMALEEKKASTQDAELNASLDNLQRALDKQNFDLVKVNAAVVMENLTMILQVLE